MLSTGTPLADRTDTKVCRISRGTQSSPSPAFLVMMRNARITLFAVRGVPILEVKTLRGREKGSLAFRVRTLGQPEGARAWNAWVQYRQGDTTVGTDRVLP